MSNTAPQLDDDQLDRIFGALSDRTRRALVRRLAVGPARVTELAEPFEISLPAISRHIKVLEAAGLVERAVDGRVHQCSLNPDVMRDAEAWLETHREFWAQSLDRLANLLESRNEDG